MTPDRWQQVKAMFQAALDRPAEERQAFVTAATVDDEVVRREVESLLRSDTSDVSFLDRLPAVSHSTINDAVVAQLGVIEQTASRAMFTPGRRVGPYEIVAPLGVGGMGEVYRASDTRLNREIALKVLPELFASDPDRLARFKREARLLATLNHPNIGAIYGLEQSNGSQALVLELVDGPTLADRIALGPIPLPEALAIARQIAQALEAAHEKGIIHRDLKPANIKMARNGVVKVLDFGLAKVWGGASRTELAGSPALTATDIGGRPTLGTPAYMSPEQARGKSLDMRTDVWSFGCVLYEMLTGGAPFSGDSMDTMDTIAAVLEREPDESMLPVGTPHPVRGLLRRCLQKDPNRRLESAADARRAIDDALAWPAGTLRVPVPSSRRTAAVALTAAAGCVLVVAFLMWTVLRRAPPAPDPALRFVIVPSDDAALNVSSNDRDVALSPDGRYFVYRAGGGAPTVGASVMVRARDELDARPLHGIYALGVFVSPDSRWIGFFTPTALMKVSITGGPPIALGPARGASLGASWGDDNAIVFATTDPMTGLWSMPSDGGEATVLTTPDAAQRGSDHAFPSVLPRGRGVLFTITAAGQADNAEVAVLDLRTGERKTLIRGGSQAEYVAPAAGRGPGYLVYAAAGALRAVQFDLERLELRGEPVSLLDRVMIKGTGAANYAVSRTGTLFYVAGGVSLQMAPRSLVWVDRKGIEEPIRAPPRAYGSPRLSPDGRRLLVGITDQENNDIWMWDISGETLKRLTFGPGPDAMGSWTPDGRRFVFTSDRDRAGVPNLYSQAADGTGAVDRLTTSGNQQFPSSVSPDGTLVAGFESVAMAGASRMAAGATWRVLLYPFAAPTRQRTTGPLSIGQPRLTAPAEPLFEGVFAEFSPDGRYLAYQSIGTERQRSEIYVRPFPSVDTGRWQISTAGGSRAVWGRNGRELFYLDASNTLTAVPVQTSKSRFTAGTPTKVFQAKYSTKYPPRPYDVSPDGRRFLMIKDHPNEDQQAGLANMIVVEHWVVELQQRLSANGR